MQYLYNLVKNRFFNSLFETVEEFPTNIYEHLNNYESSDIFEVFCALERSKELGTEIVVWSQYPPNKKEALFLCEVDVGIDLISKNDNSLEPKGSEPAVFPQYAGQCKNQDEKSYICARDIERTLLCVHHARYHLKSFELFKTIEFISDSEIRMGRTKINHSGEYTHITYDKVELSKKWMTKINENIENFIKEEDTEIGDEIILRDCQQKVLDFLEVNQEKNIFKISLPCGTGKTLIAIKWLLEVSKWLILVPSILLAEQIYDFIIKNKFASKEQIGLCYDGNEIPDALSKGKSKGKTTKKNKVICVYNSFAKIKGKKFNRIFVDEAHHILNKGINGKIVKSQERESYLDEIKEEMYKDRKVLFMSATLRNPDYKYSLRDAIEDKILVDYYIHIPIYTGNYEVALVEYFKNRIYLYSILAFCNNVESAKRFSELCVKEGLTSEWISGEMTKAKRSDILKRFKEGKIRILSSVKVLGEGIDIPYANTCAFVQPRHSYYDIIQNVGRVFRTSEGKESAHIILPGICQDDFDEEGEEITENSCKMYDFIKTLSNEDYILKDMIRNNSRRLIVDKVEPEGKNEEEDDDSEGDEDIGNIIREIIIKRIDGKQKTFDEWCYIIKEYIKKFNKLPNSQTKYENIGNFIKHTKRRFNKKLLSQDKINKLNSIDIRILQRILTFEEKVNLLKEYIDKKEKIPTAKTQYNDENIGNFVTHLRVLYKSDDLSEDKIKLLNSIDERILKIKRNSPLTFEQSVKLIQEYIEENNELPIESTIYKDSKIGKFIITSRYNYNKKNLSQDKINLLNSIDVKILTPDKQLEFEDYINIIKEYKVEFDNKIPYNTTVYKGIKIGGIITGFRSKFYKKKLPEEKVKILNDIDPLLLTSQFELYFNNNITEFTEYININKKLPEYTLIYKEKLIGQFLKNLRKNKKLPQDKIELLNSINIRILQPLNTDIKRKPFEFYIPYIKEYIEVNEKLPIQKTVYKDIKIGSFISNQRKKFNDKKLEQDKIDILNNINTKLLKP